MPGFDFNTAETVLRAGYDRSPYEAGLGWVVDLDKGHFTGRQVLLEEVDRPPLRGLHKIVVGGNKPVANALLYDKEDGEKTGEIKAATWSPILKKNLALADILYEDGKLPEQLWARVEYQRELDWFARWESCEYEKKSFMPLERRTRTPPDTR